MSIIRKHKISKLTNIPLTGRDKDVIDLIEFWFSNLTKHIFPKYPNNIFYMSPKGEWVIEVDNYMDTAYIRWKGFWEILAIEYDMYQVDIQIVILYFIYQKFGIKVQFSDSFSDVDYADLEEIYKNFQ